MIRYTFPFPIPVNNMFANSPSGGRFKSARYKSWRKAACEEVLAQGRKRLHGPVCISIALIRPDKRKRDLDGLAKGILDVLTEMQVIDDDSLVERISIQWTAAGGFECAVLIQEASEEMAA